MKIVSITAVKNEADIIESFVRYHLNIVDEMIILNNGSTDDTNYILYQLIKEGLPLFVIDDKDKYFKPVQKMNFLLKKAILEHGADIVCPIDVDEFITSEDGNPRKFIEKIKPNTYLKLKWRTYVPTEDDDVNEKFVPLRMKNIRDENLEEYKVILHKDLYNKYDVRLGIGSHDLTYHKGNFGDKISFEISKNMQMAHFPLRSKEQTLSKVLISYPNLLCRIEVNPIFGFHTSHYAPMFLKIKNKGKVSDKDVMEFAKRYSTKGNEVGENEEIKLIKKPMKLDFCKDIDIKYDYEIHPISNVLEHYVYLAKEVNKFKKDRLNDVSKSERYNKKISDLTEENLELNLEIGSLKDMLSMYQENKFENINESKYLMEIASLNEEVSKYKKEISNLQTKLNNVGRDNDLAESKETIDILINKNNEQEEYIKKLIAENESLKKN